MSEDFDGSNELEEQEMQDRELLELLDEMKARIGDEAPDLEVPPVDIWAGIESEINGDPGLGSEPGLGAAPGLLSEDSVVTSLDHHRRKRRPAGALLAAVAASVVAAIAFGSILSSSDTVIDEVALTSLEDGSSFGAATITDDDGNLQIAVDIDAELVAEEGVFYELWIIDSEVQEMYSLGRISGDESFAIPAGVDVNDFPIIDISVEPDDGNAAHSGNSAFRGLLST